MGVLERRPGGDWRGAEGGVPASCWAGGVCCCSRECKGLRAWKAVVVDLL